MSGTCHLLLPVRDIPNILSLSVVVSTIENKVFRLSSLSVENERDLERKTSIPHIHNALNKLIQNAATLSGENINPHKLCRIVLMFLNFLILSLAPFSCECPPLSTGIRWRRSRCRFLYLFSFWSSAIQ